MGGLSSQLCLMPTLSAEATCCDMFALVFLPLPSSGDLKMKSVGMSGGGAAQSKYFLHLPVTPFCFIVNAHCQKAGPDLLPQQLWEAQTWCLLPVLDPLSSHQGGNKSVPCPLLS